MAQLQKFPEARSDAGQTLTGCVVRSVPADWHAVTLDPSSVFWLDQMGKSQLGEAQRRGVHEHEPVCCSACLFRGLCISA